MLATLILSSIGVLDLLADEEIAAMTLPESSFGIGGGGILGGPGGTTGLAAIAGLALELWVLLEVKEPPLETALDIGCCMLE